MCTTFAAVWHTGLCRIFVVLLPSLKKKQNTPKPACGTSSHTRPIEKSLVGHAAHLNSLKTMPHPAGGSCWKEERDSASASETNTGWREEDILRPALCSQCSQRYSWSSLIAARWEQPASSLDRCQVGTEETDWLINSVYLGSPHQTDSLHCRAAGDILKVNLINTEQCHITGCSRTMWGRGEVG